MSRFCFLAALLLFCACKTPSEKGAQATGTDPLSAASQTAMLPAGEVDATSLPAGISYEGAFKKALRWTDAAGDNLVILTETGIHPTEAAHPEMEDASDASLYAYHYLLTGSQNRLTWKVYDFMKECPVDVSAAFLKDEFRITDLNQDGMAETWLMYKITCRSDVSPAEMKIIMYEGDRKYALRGENKVEMGTEPDGKSQFTGGDYTFDSSFQKGPQAFRDFALKMWNRNLMEKWEE